MSQMSESKLPVADELSSLMDGELDASAVARACAQWRDDGEVRAQWHAYQVIGDVLRSEDLASPGAHDAAFLAAFRARLAQEPVVLAPSPAKTPVLPLQPTRRLSWATPVAVAAGFVAVAGVLVVTQMSGGLSLPGAQSPSLMAAASGVSPAMVGADDSASAVVAVDVPAVVLNGQLIRDVRLDEYLAAHKKFGGSSVPGGPSGFLRNAAADGTAR
jgi:sigma-E factor negative regulatory protein RseA